MQNNNTFSETIETGIFLDIKALSKRKVHEEFLFPINIKGDLDPITKVRVVSVLKIQELLTERYYFMDDVDFTNELKRNLQIGKFANWVEFDYRFSKSSKGMKEVDELSNPLRSLNTYIFDSLISLQDVTFEHNVSIEEGAVLTIGLIYVPRQPVTLENLKVTMEPLFKHPKFLMELKHAFIPNIHMRSKQLLRGF